MSGNPVKPEFSRLVPVEDIGAGVKRRIAAAGDPRSTTASTAGRAGADVGEGPKRRGAKRASRYDR